MKIIVEGEFDKVVFVWVIDLYFVSSVNAVVMMVVSCWLNLNCYYFYMVFDGENVFFGFLLEWLWWWCDKVLCIEVLVGIVVNNFDDK